MSDGVLSQVRILSLRVVDLDSEHEDIFWRHVNADPLDYYFFIYDRKLNPNDTRILLALDRDEVEGAMLIYKDAVFQARGSRVAIDVLLDHLDIESAEGSVPMDCRDLLLSRYRSPKEYQIVLMHLRRGDENLIIPHETARLHEAQAEEIAKLIREANPDWWAETKTEDIKKSLGFSLWLGIMEGGKVASLASTRLLDFGSNVSIVATHKDFRNKGYATSVVSAVLREIFREHDKALIHVLSDNRPARHVYEKVGFRPYRNYFQIKGGHRIAAK